MAAKHPKTACLKIEYFHSRNSKRVSTLAHFPGFSIFSHISYDGSMLSVCLCTINIPTFYHQCTISLPPYTTAVPPNPFMYWYFLSLLPPGWVMIFQIWYHFGVIIVSGNTLGVRQTFPSSIQGAIRDYLPALRVRLARRLVVTKMIFPRLMQASSDIS